MFKNIFGLSIVLFLINPVIAQNKQEKLQYYLVTSQYNNALEICSQLISESPDNANLYYHQSVICKQLFKYPESIKSIEKAIELDSENTIYLSEYATILAKKDRDSQAYNVWERVLEKDSANINAGIYVANQLIKSKKYDKAYRIFQRLFNADTLNGFFARNLGFCSIKLLDSKNSINWLSLAIKLDSTDIKAYEHLAVVYTSLEKYEIAIEILNKAIRFDPENVNLFIKIGEIHVMQNHNYQAIPAFEKALKLEPVNDYVLKNIGSCHFYIEEYTEAKHYLKLVELFINDAQIFQYLGDIYSKLGPIDSSIIYYNKALELVKPDYISLFLLNDKKGKSYYALNDFPKAIEAFNKAINLEVDEKIWIRFQQDKLIIDIASIYSDKLKDKKTAIEYYKKIKKPEIIINKDYYGYAQEQIKRLNEELFFEGKL